MESNVAASEEPPQAPSLPRVAVYFDFISPYAYLGWVELRRMETMGLLSLQPNPILFAGLLNAHGTLGPAEVEAKKKFVFLDSLRKAALLRIPLNPPSGHPFNPLLPLRLATACEPTHQNVLIDLLFAATWRDGVEVSSSEQLRKFLEGSVPDQLDLDRLWEAAKSLKIKAKLRSDTDSAIALDIFGVPSFVHDGELYWGVDNIPALRASLLGEQLVTSEQRASWQDLRSLAKRKLAASSPPPESH